MSSTQPAISLDEALYALNYKRAEVSINVNAPDGSAKSELRVTLLRQGLKSPVMTKTLQPPLASPVRVSFNLRGQERGSYTIKAECIRDGTVVASGESRPLPYNPLPKVGLNPDGFLTVEGKPYFPVGIYTLQDKEGKNHDAVLKEAKEAGFNTTVFYAYTVESVTPLLDAALRNGVMAFVYPTTPFSVRTKPVTDEDIVRDVQARMKHPAVLGWYVVDEPEGIGKAAAEMVRDLYQTIKEVDQDHPCSLVVMSSGAAAKYSDCTDVMWIDPYPIPHEPVTAVSERVGGAVKVVQKDKPVWGVPQAFDWSVWNTGKIDGEHRPTNAEERCMTYLALVHGAKGIIYWAHTASKYYIRDYPEHWAYMKKIAGELRDLTPVLLARTSKDKLTVSPDDATIDTMVKKLNSGTYVFAVNRERKECAASLTLPGSIAPNAQVLFEGRSVDVKNGSWQDTFKPLEVHVYKVIGK